MPPDSSDTTEPDALDGIRQPATDDWIAAHGGELTLPFEWTRLTGGTSNLTYAITDANGRRAVVRRPPTGRLLPRAHDMEREHRIITALASTPVPVARPIALCQDKGVTDAPFYVMDFCDGRTAAGSGTRMRNWTSEARARMGASMVDALVALHSVDPGEVGLADLGRPDDYIARQLNRWMESWQRSNGIAQLDLPEVQASFDFLSQRIPPQGPARVCHGDYGPHNLLVSEEGRVTAITDWEIGTLGEPRADLTYLLLAWGEMDLSSADAFFNSSLGEGYATRRELLARYEEQSGQSIPDLWFYIAFNTFKMCCIVQGVYARFVGGVRAAQGEDVESYRAEIHRLAQAATSAIGLL